MDKQSPDSEADTTATVVDVEKSKDSDEIKKDIKSDISQKAAFERNLTFVKFVGQDETSSQKTVNAPTAGLSTVAHIHTKYPIVNLLWLVLVTLFTPACFALLWFGAIPLGDAEGDFKNRVVWGFVVNAGTYVFFSFMLVNIFLACLDGNNPWRPLKYYAPVLALVYVLQVAFIGTIAFVHGTFRVLGLVAIAISIFTTVAGMHLIPHRYFDCDRDRYLKKLKTFTKILAFFVIFWIVLLGYIIANGSTDSSAQGLLTVALSVITFIFKKIFLSLTDGYPIEVSMVISGLWLENIVDLFIALAYPSATRSAPTFAVIWITRVAENTAFLGFQLDVWFRFRVWIKSKFKRDQAVPIEEDLDDDDRGHSNQHPGYRRRQLRFLVWKLCSQISSSAFFMAVIPALRYGQNRRSYPYSDEVLDDFDALNDEAIQPLKADTFQKAMYFALFSLFTTFCSGAIIFLWMWKYQKSTLDNLRERYRFLIVSDKYFGFVVTVLISNVLLAVSAVQVNNRLYYI